MNRNEFPGRPEPATEVPRPSRLRRWGKALVFSAAAVLGLMVFAAPPAQAADYGRYGSPRGYGSYSGYAYGGYGDPYHYYTGPRNHHYGPHSAPHVGSHFHWRHGYHYGPHWQRHDDDHSKGGHFGFCPWRPH